MSRASLVSRYFNMTKLPDNWTGRYADFEGVVHAPRPFRNRHDVRGVGLLVACREFSVQSSAYVCPSQVTCLGCIAATDAGAFDAVE